MKITALKETRAGRVSLCLDGEYVASLDVLTLGEYGLCVGDELSEETVAEILRLSQSRRAKSKALELLSYRPHSRAELKRKLLRSATEEDAQRAVERMEELEMVNDRTFAEALVRELSVIKLYGINRVKQELFRRGIPRDTAEEALALLPDQSEILARYISGRRVVLKGSFKDRDKLARKLISRGFSYDDVSVALSEFEVEE